MPDIGFAVPGITGQVVPDRTLSRSSKPKVRTATFGDGYEQRIADGLNSIEETYSLTFNNRTKAEADDIIAFFDSNKGVSSFSFTYPDSNSGTNDSAGNPVTTIKVVCDTYNLRYTNDDFYGVNASFRRVYEP
tara:strand:- start:3033 stop:3431 length:399 start_codon:yes stop_codon:yes gene_type:complete